MVCTSDWIEKGGPTLTATGRGIKWQWVARWYIFKPKIPIWVNFGGFFNGRCWYIIWPIGIVYDYLVYFGPIR
jgi:hypothetical protein